MRIVSNFYKKILFLIEKSLVLKKLYQLCDKTDITHVRT